MVGFEAKKMRQGPTAPIPVPGVGMNATAHWIIMSEKRGRCRVPGCKDTLKTKCRKCNVHPCFTSSEKVNIVSVLKIKLPLFDVCIWTDKKVIYIQIPFPDKLGYLGNCN